MYALLTHFNTQYTFGKNTKIIMNDGLAPFYMNQKDTKLKRNVVKWDMFGYSQ